MTEEKKKKKKSYDTRVKFLVRKGLLPDIYRKQIHRSLISKWKREADDKYVGYELNNNNIPEVYELMKKISEDEKMQRALKTFYKITKTFEDIIGSGREYVNILRKEKTRVVRIVEGAKDNLGIKKAIEKTSELVGSFRPIRKVSICGNCGLKDEKITDKCPTCKSPYILA